MSELVGATLRTLFFAGSATILAFCWSVPMACLLALWRSRASEVLVAVFNALVAVPTTVVGLLIYLLFCRRGPLWFIPILFTPAAVILGEALLVTPLMVSLLHSAIVIARDTYYELALALGASRSQAIALALSEMYPQIIEAILLSFCRAAGELGVVTIAGGAIRGYTRTLSAAIVLAVEMGELDLALALGGVLLLLVLSIALPLRLVSARARGVA